MTVDPDAARRGEDFASRHGSSLSQLVTNLLHALPESSGVDEQLAQHLSPSVQRLLGAARAVPSDDASDRASFRAHLLEKYGAA